MKRVVLLFVLIIYFGGTLFPLPVFNREKRDSVVTYSVCDKALSVLLDSFIVQEEKYQYYDDSCSFVLFMGLTQEDSCLYLGINSGCSGNKTDSILKYNGLDVGEEYLLFYNKHTIFIRTDDISLLNGLIAPNNQKYYVKYCKPSRIRVCVLNRIFKRLALKRVICEGIDESLENQWICFYIQGEFYVPSKMIGNIPLKSCD